MGAANHMVSTSAQRVCAGVSLLFAPGERPGLDALRAALDSCQTQAEIIHADEDRGTADVIVSGLVFEVDGLAPAAVQGADPTGGDHGFSDSSLSEGQHAVRLFPGHALSGGLSLAAVSRALLALAAELAVSLPVHAVRWHPADTVIDAHAFSRSVLAWLAGGAFPAPGLVALTRLADGSVVSRGLAHFVGQEMTLRGDTDEHGLKLAARVVDQIVRTGPLLSFTQWRLLDTLVNAEPARQAKQILVWKAE